MALSWCASLADPIVSGKLSAPVADLPADLQSRFLSRLAELPDDVAVISMRELSWPMAELQQRHRAAGRPMSAAMVEALAAAHRLHAGIAVSKHDIGSNLRAAARADGIAFHTL